MPNIRSQRIDPDGTITIVASNGKTFRVTRAEINAFLAAMGPGVEALRRAGATTAIRAAVAAALGPELINLTSIKFKHNWDDSTTLPDLGVS